MHCLHYQRWFRMEGEFGSGMQQIFERLGFSGPELESILATQKNTSPRIADSVYTAELAARVRSLYARDFELFGYETDSWRGV